MDYLHGDVVDESVRAACQDEYARESNVLCKAAELLRRDPTADAAEISFKIEDEFHCGSWFFQGEWSSFGNVHRFRKRVGINLVRQQRGELLSWPASFHIKVRPWFG